MRERLQTALRGAMKARDRAAVAALRSTLAALDNAQAVEADVAPVEHEHFAGTAGGLGAGEAPRAALDEPRRARSSPARCRSGATRRTIPSATAATTRPPACARACRRCARVRAVRVHAAPCARAVGDLLENVVVARARMPPRCRECGRYWAEDCIHRSRRPASAYPIETDDLHGWPRAPEPVTRTSPRGHGGLRCGGSLS